MPLAHTAYRPQPEVELLGAEPITIEDAVRGLEAAVAADEGVDDAEGSALVNFRMVPRILESLKTDWAGLPAGERPACFVKVHGRLETHMHPCFLGEKLVAGLRGASGQLLLKFSSVLDCVPLGFTSIGPAGPLAATVGESPYVHFLADFWAVGFVPKESQWLMGRISDIQTAKGMNLQILNSFNFFAPRWTLPTQLWFDHAAGRWTDDTVPADSTLAKEWGTVWVQIKGKMAESSGPYPFNFRGTLHGPRRPGEFPGDSQDPAMDPAAGVGAKKRQFTSASEEAAEKAAKRAKKKEAAEAAAASEKAAAEAPAASPAKVKQEPKSKEASAAAEAASPAKVKMEPKSKAPNLFEEASAAAEAEAAALQKAKEERRKSRKADKAEAEAATEAAAEKAEAKAKKKVIQDLKDQISSLEETVKEEQADNSSAVDVLKKKKEKKAKAES